jgi:hypothetical protein
MVRPGPSKRRSAKEAIATRQQRKLISRAERHEIDQEGSCKGLRISAERQKCQKLQGLCGTVIPSLFYSQVKGNTKDV